MTISRRILSIVSFGVFNIPFVMLCGCFSNAVAQGVEAQQRPPAQGRRIANPLAVFPKDRILQRINRSATVTLTGHVHRRAQAEFDAGPVAGDAKMPGMILVLKRDQEQQEALDALSAALQDPSSSMYQQWLTPAEFGLHFGVSQNDLDQVMSWLRSEGFTIDDVPAGHWMIVFSGTAAQVENAFHAGIRNYRIGENVYYANSQDPRIPEALSGVVQSISGLHNFPPVPASGPKIVPDAVSTSGNHYLLPSDFATIYNLNPLYTSGYNSSGVNIAVIAPCAAAATVLPVAQAFWTLEQLSSVSSSYWYYGTPTACTSSSGFLTEAELDVEWSGAVAQGAKIWLVSSNAADPLLGAITGIVNSGVGSSNTFVPVISMSYIEPEIPSYHQTWNSLWQQAHVSGITGVVSSGDTGAAAADLNGNATTAMYGLVINGLCASPYVVCVGGTQFNDVSNPGQYWSSSGAAQGYIPEVAWNESGSNGGSGLWSSGGGYSTFSAKPSWQTGNTNQYRGVPDVALSAAAMHDGYLICIDGAPCNSSGYVPVGGTSASTPSFAGIIALLVGKSGAQGNVNQTMYALASRSDLGTIFHDITQGNNTVPGQTGYSAGPGWDAVTGLGSVDANALISNWGAITPGPAVTLSAAALNFGYQMPGTASATPLVVTLTNSGGAALTVTTINISGTNASDFAQTNTCPTSAIAANGTCTITLTFTPAAIGARTATLNVFDTAVGSPHTVALAGAGGAGTANTYHVFPQIADGYTGDGHYVQSVLIITANPATNSPNCTLQFQGGTIGTRSPVSISFSGVYVYTTSGNGQALQTGYATLSCNYLVDAQLLYAYYAPNGTKISEATVFSSPPATLFAMVADERNGSQLALALANDSTASSSYIVPVYNFTSGLLLSQPVVTVGAKQNSASYIYQLMGESTSDNLLKLVEISAQSNPASAIGLRYTGNLFTTMPASIITASTPSATARSYHVFPQFADGYTNDGHYIQSTLVMINPGSSSTNCTLQWTGSVWGSAGTTTFTLGGAALISGMGNQQSLKTGYATLQCSSNIEAEFLYAYYSSNGTKISEATVFSSPSGNTVRIVADERGGAELAFAVANDSTQAGSYTIKAYDLTGKQIGSASMPVNSKQNAATYLYQILGLSGSSNSVSYVDFISQSGTASVIGLRYTGNLFTTIPASVIQ